MQLYVVRSKVNKISGEGKALYYGVPILSGQVTEERLAAEICYRSSLTEADVLSAIHSLKDLIREHLEAGEAVKIKGIGKFFVSAGSKGFETPGECTPAEVKARRVCFMADNEMRSVVYKMKYKLYGKEKKNENHPLPE